MFTNSKEVTVIGVDLGGTNVKSGRIEGNQISEKSKINISSKDSKQKVIDEVKESISGVWNEQVDGIGIGVPGLANSEKGIVYDIVNIPSWDEVHLKEEMENEFNVPVYINNDANCFAVGEKYFGKGQDIDNMVGLIIGTGLGAGIIANGHLYSGEYCGAGEFGMVKYQDKNYEAFCSGTGLKDIYNVKGEDLFKRAKNGEQEALKIFREFGNYLGEAIQTILYAIAPKMIVFGGSVSKSTEFFIEEVYKNMEDFPYPKSVENLTIEVSEINDIAIYGAAALYLDDTNSN